MSNTTLPSYVPFVLSIATALPLVPGTSEARPGPGRTAARAAHPARPAPVDFAGQRTMPSTGPKIPSAVRDRLAAPGAAPTPHPAKMPTGPVTLSELTQPKGGAPVPGPVAAAPESAAEYLFVAAQSLGRVVGELRVQSAQFEFWSRDGMTMKSDHALALRVVKPPTGKVAFVRCGVTVSDDSRKYDVSATSNGATKTMALPKGGGLLTFEVFQGQGADIATLKLKAPPGAAESLRWTVTGCDRSVP